MTRSAPIDVHEVDVPRVLQTPVTSAPSAFAICTANVPTPPAAPLTRTRCPASSRPLSRRAWSAVTPASGIAAACSNVRPAGFAARTFFGPAHTYSASAPAFAPNTSSPGWNAVTFSPTASTTPATSIPRIGCFGRPRPSDRRTR